jgi:hypothetical protein
VAGELLHPLARSGVPQDDGPALAGRGEQVADRGEGQGADGGGAVAGQYPGDFALFERDEEDGAGVLLAPKDAEAADGQGLGAGRQGGGEQFALLARPDGRPQHPGRLVAGDVPDADGLVQRHRDEPGLLLVTGEQDLGDLGAVPARLDGEEGPAGGHLRLVGRHQDRGEDQQGKGKAAFHGVSLGSGGNG